MYYPGVVESCERLPKDAYGRSRYTVRAWCPHCGGKNSYEDIALRRLNADTFSFLHCRKCTRRYSIPDLSLMQDHLPGASKRMFSSNFPPQNLMKAYLARGGQLDELAAMMPGGKTRKRNVNIQDRRDK